MLSRVIFEKDTFLYSGFMYSEVRIGFVAALVATFLPLRLSGRDIREILLNPEFVAAERALEIGLVNRVVSRAELESCGRELAEEILSRASSSSLALTKRLLTRSMSSTLDGQLEAEAFAQETAGQSFDHAEGVRAFIEKRPPAFRGE